MKKIFFIFISLLIVSNSLLSLDKEPEILFHYSFVLSCGKTIYRSFDHQLSDAELLEWTDFFEDTICGGNNQGESGIQ